uniref:Retinol dehydrogenase 13 n=1 Tax=Rousettus aegyptiacus TaxID=9407 RepID=A0A7J8CL02_ROUAE|nr:retinol dehydrogenase 13 [Rousettus aegyptiacus]
MNRYLVPASLLGTAVGGAVLFKDYVSGGACPSKATIQGKTVIVTGANTGIGKQTALELARRGGNIILACRDMEKCEAAAKDIRRETLNHCVNARRLDLASLKSIREFAAKIIEEEERVHVLVNNAAVMRCPHWTTEDGFEIQLGVNHLGHFLLTNLLLDKLKASAPSRIINLSSLAHIAGHIDFDDLNWEKRKYDTKAAYCQSKLAVVLFTKELSRRLQVFPLLPRHRCDRQCSASWCGQDRAGQTHRHAQLYLLQLHAWTHLLATGEEPPAGGPAQYLSGCGRRTGGCFWKVLPWTQREGSCPRGRGCGGGPEALG